MATPKDTNALDIAQLDALRVSIEALPLDIDGINLSQARQMALIQLDQLATSVKILRKLST